MLPSFSNASWSDPIIFLALDCELVHALDIFPIQVNMKTVNLPLYYDVQTMEIKRFNNDLFRCLA